MTARRFLLVLLAAGCVAGCRKSEPHEDSEETEAAQPIAVRATPARRGDITETLDAIGETMALSTVRLASPIAGRATYLEARPGDRLAAGQVAARVLSLENEAALHGLELLKQSRSVTPAERERSDALRKELSGREIPVRAPFAAVVAERPKNPGEQVAQGDVLLELFDPRSLVVLAQVPTESSRRLKHGMPVEVTGSGIDGRGTVDALVPALSSATLTIPVRVLLEKQPDLPLLHAAVRCRITIDDHPNALLVPRAALISAGSESEGDVMVAANDRAERRKITLGLRTADVVEVVSGLSEGEPVISEGQYSLPDKAPIRLETSDTGEEEGAEGEGSPGNSKDQQPGEEKPAKAKPAQGDE
jgi:membrane fusion protein (multidrug efflux system)